MKFVDGGYEWIEDDPAGDNMRVFVRGREADPPKERWTIQTPYGPQACWLDDENQERWVSPESDMTECGWRRVYLEVRP